jgi:hypothetical protein
LDFLEAAAKNPEKSYLFADGPRNYAFAHNLL